MNEPLGNWSVETIAGKTVDVYAPTGDRNRESALIYLHDEDLQTPRTDEVLTRLLAESRLLCVCPHGGESWWLDWPCPQFGDDVTPLQFVREQVTSWIEAEWKVAPPAIGLLGTGMGGQGVLQLAYRNARTFPVVAAISPMVDFHMLYGRGGPLDAMFDSAEAARQQTATLHLHPLNWPPEQMIVCDPADELRYDGCERLLSKLASIGIPFEADLKSSTAGDRPAYLRQKAAKCLSFVADGLRKVQRR